MNKLFIAVENDEVMPDGSLEDDIAVIDSNSAAIAQLSDSAQEGSDIQETLGQMDAAPGQAAQIAKEHLMSRLMLSSNVSMESVEHRVDRGQSIAQEGIGARLKETIKRVFTSDQKLLKLLESSMEKVKTGEMSESSIEEPGWGRIFTAGSKTTISGKDAIATAREFVKVINGNDLITVLEKIGLTLQKTADQLNKSTFVADDAAVAEIERLGAELDEIESKIGKLLPNVTSVRRDVNFKPLDKKEAVELSKITEDLIDNNKLTNALARFSEKSNEYNAVMITNHFTRLKTVIGLPAADLKAARNVVSRSNRMVTVVNNILTDRSKLAYGSVKYITSSVK
jgi:uncharacterized protein Yka (UPF0111/DUF47 family)